VFAFGNCHEKHLLGSALLALYRGTYSVGLKFSPLNATFNEFSTFFPPIFSAFCRFFFVHPVCSSARQAGAVSFVALASPAQNTRAEQVRPRASKLQRLQQWQMLQELRTAGTQAFSIFYALCVLPKMLQNVFFGRYCTLLMKVSGRNGCYPLLPICFPGARSIKTSLIIFYSN